MPAARGDISLEQTIGAGRDLSGQVTAFVTTVGALTFADCIRHLEEQDVRVRFEVIDGVAPLPAALQLMLDRCATRYFVQVDEDMLLESDAIGRLYDLIEAEYPNVGLLVGRLHDPHLGRWIEGVKIHRHDFSSKFPWNAYANVLERNAAMFAAGYRVARRPLEESGQRMIFGMHVVGTDPRTIFDRYRDLELLRMDNPDQMDWFAVYGEEFTRRLADQPDEIDFYALMGILAASVRGRPANAEQPIKDFRRPPDAAFVGAAQLWAALRGPQPR